jgi:hypothetical protein
VLLLQQQSGGVLILPSHRGLRRPGGVAVLVLKDQAPLAVVFRDEQGE